MKTVHDHDMVYDMIRSICLRLNCALQFVFPVRSISCVCIFIGHRRREREPRVSKYIALAVS